jgi:hypothetical protein
MSQQSLFAAEPLPAHNGRSTSIAAAVAIRPSAGTLRQQVLAAIEAAGERGLTDEECQDAMGIPGNTVRPRRGELTKAGLIVQAPFTRPTRAGRQAVVWRVQQ